MLHETIILDTKIPVKALDDFNKTLPKEFEEDTTGSVYELFHYLADKESCRGEVLDLLHEMRHELQERDCDEELIDKLVVLKHELARAMWEEMVNFKIYTHSGTNWYSPVRLLDYDLVIQLIQDRETIMEDLNEKP